MNHPSEWAKFFDERTGRYRYKHQGSGVVRDTLTAIGKAFKKGATKVVKHTANKTAEKAAVEKGFKKLKQILRKRQPKTAAPAKNKASLQDAMMKLAQILGNQLRISNFFQ